MSEVLGHTMRCGAFTAVRDLPIAVRPGEIRGLDLSPKMPR